MTMQPLSYLNSRHLSCLSSRHVSFLNSRHPSCLKRRHLQHLRLPGDQALPTPGGRDSSRLGLSVRTWFAEAATAADLNGGAGGPPKPRAAYENQPDGAAGRPSGPDGAQEGPWGRRGVPRGSEHQLCTNTGQASDPSDDHKPRAALKGTHFFWRKLTYPKNDIFFGFSVTRQTALPIQIVPRFCASGCGRFKKLKLLYGCQNPLCWDIVGD